MATIAQRVTKTGVKSWQVTIRIKDHPKIVKTLPTKIAALRFAEEVEEQLRNGAQDSAPPAKKITLFEFEKEELRSVIENYRSSSRFRQRWKGAASTVLANMTDTTIGCIDKNWISAYLDKMRAKKTDRGQPYAWETLVGHFKLIKLSIKWRAGIANIPTPVFPLDKSMLPKHWQNKRTRRLLDHEEAALRLQLATAPESQRRHWIALLDLALETGARQGELVRSTWDQFSLESKTWTLPAEATKSKVSRSIPLSMKARAVIVELHAMAEVKSDRLFHCFRNPQLVSLLFSEHAKRAGLRDFRFHDLRHEAVSRLVLFKRKLSVYEIMRIVGHSNMEMLNRYANLRTDELADRMD